MNATQPVVFLPHGGGPLPILGEKSHAPLTRYLGNISSRLGKPELILMISAHWEADTVTLTAGKQPELIYDYYGFPPSAYEIEYPVSGSPELAQQVQVYLEGKGIASTLSKERGFDHGLFIPLKLVYPLADVQCVQLSLDQTLNPTTHIEIGKALAPLRDQGVLIIGSGMSFHNMQAFYSELDSKANQAFDQWLINICTNPDLSLSQKEQGLIGWKHATGARYSHPREEHLLPLHVCFGAASEQSHTAELSFHDKLLGAMVSGFIWL